MAADPTIPDPRRAQPNAVASAHRDATTGRPPEIAGRIAAGRIIPRREPPRRPSAPALPAPAPSPAPPQAAPPVPAQRHPPSAPAADARHIVARFASHCLEGGHAAVLPPARRALVLKLAARLGLRPFDANLVIAIVQDAARAGQDSQAPAVSDRLALVRGPCPPRALGPGASILIAASLAAAIFLGLIALVSF